MIKILRDLLWPALCGAVLLSGCAGADAKKTAGGEGVYIKTKTGFTLELKGKSVTLQVFAPGTIRVFAGARGAKPEESLCVTAEPGGTKWALFEEKGSLLIKTEKLHVKVSTADALITYQTTDGRTLLKEGARTAEKEDGNPHYTVKQGFIFDAKEGIYGLGQFEDGIINFRGKEQLLVQANRVAVNPFLVSSKGYGILWDNYSETLFRDGKKGASFSSEAAAGIDYYFVYGGTMDGAIAGYRQLTGDAPMFPKWAFGYWQSKERYMKQEETVEVLKEYRRRGIPIDAVVQDWQYWGGNELFSGMTWDKERFPDPAKMVNDIHNLDGKIMVSIWPAFGPKTGIYSEMEKKGLLFSAAHWSGGKVYDAYSAKARGIYWKHVKRGLYDIGVDAYWMDGTEPEFRCTDDRNATAASIKAEKKNALGEAAYYLNPYTLLTTQGVYEGHRAASGSKRAFILTRSAFSGQQRNAAVTWSGDTFAGWESFRGQVAAGISFCMSGIPYWTCDIGGFITEFKYPKGLDDPAFRELYVRWFQYGAFCPVFRAHGTNIPREVWRFGDEESQEYKALVKFIKLRYSLVPYIYSVAAMVTRSGYTMMRGLPMDFPEDKKAAGIGSEFMFGPSILVCPVTKELYNRTESRGEYISGSNLLYTDGKQQGLKLEIFRDLEFTDKAAERKLDISNLGWFGCIPDGIEKDYSARMTGMVLAPETGEYEFIAMTDGAVRVSVDGKVMIDGWDNRQAGSFSGKAGLKKGRKYRIKVEHRQYKPWNAYMKLLWVRPGDEAREKKDFTVYLPSGPDWYDFWTNEKMKGGRTLALKPALDTMPLFVKEGSILAFGPEVTHAAEKTGPIELKIYPGRDASFTLYSDEGDNYNYEKGKFAEVELKWDNKNRTLYIGKLSGGYDGMPREQVFRAGIAGSGLEPKEILYKGNETVVIF